MDHSHWVLFSTSTTKVHVAQALNVSLMPIALIDFLQEAHIYLKLFSHPCLWSCLVVPTSRSLHGFAFAHCVVPITETLRTLWDIWKWPKLCFWTQMQQKRSYLFCIFNDINHYLKESEKHRTSMAFVEGWQEKALYIQKECKAEFNVIQLKLRF